MGSPLSDKKLALMDAYWRVANYLSIGPNDLFRGVNLHHAPREET